MAAMATAVGFLAFVPTEFRGVAELGLIAGVGMLIAFVCTMTFLPAMIGLCRPHGEAAEIGFGWAVPLDEAVRRRRRPIVIAFAALAVLSVLLLPRLAFDADPLHTKNPHTEAMRTLRDLMTSPLTNPFTIDILVPNVAAAEALERRLKSLPLVSGVESINSFVPEHQQAKLEQIADAALLLAPIFAPQPPQPPLTAAAIRTAAGNARAGLKQAVAARPSDRLLAAIADDLGKLAAAPDALLLAANRALTRFLPAQLDKLRTALSAQPVSLQSLPPTLARDWLLPDGRARIRVLPKEEAANSRGLAKFVTAVTAVAPDAGGAAVTIEATSATIVGAFRSAALAALAAIAVILFVALRRVLDMSMVLAPLLLSSLLTVHRHGAAAAAAQLRQHHRLAAAARRRRIVQRLLRDELAGRSGRDARLGDRARHPVLGADHRHRLRLAGAVGAPRNREHGPAVADQPRLHPGREPRLHPGLIGDGPGAGAAHRSRDRSGSAMRLGKNCAASAPYVVPDASVPGRPPARACPGPPARAGGGGGRSGDRRDTPHHEVR